MRIRDTSTNEIWKRISEFEWVTADWNCDGDVYPLYGARFKSEEDGSIQWIEKNWISNDSSNYFEIIER